jgi:prophage regulatory protein
MSEAIQAVAGTGRSVEPLVYRWSNITIAVGLSRSEIYRRIEAGTFPKPVAIGPRAVGWAAETVKTYTAEMLGQR